MGLKWQRRLAGACAIVVTGTVMACSQATSSGEAPAATLTGTSAVQRDDNDSANLSIEDFIQRRVSGVVVQRDGGNLSIQIRGQGTLGGRTNALVVIDGVMQDSPNALLTIKPIEIERMEVLKDAAAARYGLHGANGVLVITLRRDR